MTVPLEDRVTQSLEAFAAPVTASPDLADRVLARGRKVRRRQRRLAAAATVTAVAVLAAGVVIVSRDPARQGQSNPWPRLRTAC